MLMFCVCMVKSVYFSVYLFNYYIKALYIQMACTFPCFLWGWKNKVRSKPRWSAKNCSSCTGHLKFALKASQPRYTTAVKERSLDSNARTKIFSQKTCHLTVPYYLLAQHNKVLIETPCGQNCWPQNLHLQDLIGHGNPCHEAGSLWFVNASTLQ